MKTNHPAIACNWGFAVNTIKHLRTAVFALIAMLTAGLAHGDEVNVVSAKATQTGDGVYRFDVGLTHADTGWDHYANAWRVLAPDGTLLGERTLYHPHVDEQPFVRSLSGVRIPAGISMVTIEGVDSVHGSGGPTMTVALPER